MSYLPLTLMNVLFIVKGIKKYIKNVEEHLIKGKKYSWSIFLRNPDSSIFNLTLNCDHAVCTVHTPL